MRLENGYYTANKAEVGHYTEKPDSLKNYLFYEDGVLTVFGGIVVGNSGTEDWKAVLSVESGSLTIKGSGILKLNGTGMSGLYVDRNHADINIDLAEGDALGQISNQEHKCLHGTGRFDRHECVVCRNCNGH